MKRPITRRYVQCMGIKTDLLALVIRIFKSISFLKRINLTGNSLNLSFDLGIIRVNGAASCNINKFLSKRQFCRIFIGHFMEIFHYFSQNESIILKGFLKFVEKQMKHPIHQNLCRTQWRCVGKKTEYRDTGFF